MGTINLSGRLSSVATNGSTITKSGSRYVVTGGITMLNGGVIDVPVLVDYIEFDGVTYPNAVGAIGLKDSPTSGDFFPIDIEITGVSNWVYATDPFRTRGIITVNTYNCNIRFTSGSNSTFMTWPGSASQSGVKWNAENVNVIALTSPGTPTLSIGECFPAGGGILSNVTFQGFNKIFFTGSPASSTNVRNVRTNGTYGLTGDTASYELVGGSSDCVCAQRISTSTYTDFQITKTASFNTVDVLLKTMQFKRRFTSSIQGGGAYKYWVWDKNKSNVLSSSTVSGVLPVTAVQWQSLSATSTAATYSPSQINSIGTNLKAPLAVRAYSYGKVPLTDTVAIDVSSASVTSPYTLTAIDANDTSITLSKITVAAATHCSDNENLYCQFYSWYESNGHLIHPDDISLPTINDFKNWNIAINAQAAAVFSVNTSTKTLTVKSAVFSASLTTTGTINFSNGAAVGGLLTDSTGGTKQITGVDGSYVHILDNLGNTVVAYALQTGEIYHRTVTGRTYTIKVRSIGYSSYVGTYSSSTGAFAVNLERDKVLWPLDSTLTVTDLRTAADALSGYTLAKNGNLNFPPNGTLANAYLSFSRQVEVDLSKTIPAYNGATMYGVAQGSMSSGALAGNGSLVLSGTWTGSLGTVSIEDANGVRVVVAKMGGGNFNISARKGTTGAYTDLGFQSDVSSVTYTVPRGTQVEVVMWSLGCVTYSRTISTVSGGVVLNAEMAINSSINTSLDVSSYLTNISLSLDTSGTTPFFVITFNAAMTVSGIELGKALVHRLVGQEMALRAGFPPGSTSTIVINADEITNQLPAVRLDVGASIPVTGRVYLDFFINTSAAQAVNSVYAINPPRADGNQVQILRAKPALDASQLSASVWSASQRTLTSASTARPSIDF